MDTTGTSHLLRALLNIEETLSASFRVTPCLNAIEELAQLRPLEAAEPFRLLLSDVRGELERRTAQEDADPILIQLEAPKQLVSRVQALRLALGGPLLVYHGTTLGRLSSIASEGLVPAKPAVWKTAGLEDHRSGNVFFTGELVAAMRWAEVARSHGKGRKSGASRKPVVIRLKAEGLALAPDKRGVIGTCYQVAGSVPVNTAMVRIVDGTDEAGWMDIPTALARARSS